MAASELERNLRALGFASAYVLASSLYRVAGVPGRGETARYRGWVDCLDLDVFESAILGVRSPELCLFIGDRGTGMS